MSRHIQGIDHAVVAVRELERARDTYARMGFTLTPRGRHSIGSENHCIMFSADYLELLAVPTQHPATAYYSDYLAEGEGLAALALKTDDAQAAFNDLDRAGLHPEAPLDFSRPVELPGGTREAKFRITQIPTSRTPGGRIFLCQHFTRDVVWRSDSLLHANSVTGLTKVVLASDNPRAAATLYERVFDRDATPVPGGLAISSGGAPIVIYANDEALKRYRGIALALREPSCFAALHLRVASIEALARCLAAGNIAHQALGEDSVAVGAEAAHGVALIFSA